VASSSLIRSPPGHLSALGQKGEHRQVTVLVADLVGFTAFVERAGEEAAYGLMRQLASLMTDAVHRYRGSVKDFAGDGILALFGAAPDFEDAPLQACRAALYVQQRLTEVGDAIEAQFGLRPQMRVSITTGPVVLGAVDSGETTLVTAFGDVVNLAARLQTKAAPGTVVMSEAMLRRVEGMVEAESTGAFSFKGKSEPQRIYRLLAVRERATRFDAALARGLTEYVGRGDELSLLARQFQRLDSIRVVDIVGDPGIGKTRLLHEFVLRHRSEHFFLLRGNCSADGQETPFLPFIELVREAFSFDVAEDPATIIQKLTSGLKLLDKDSPESLGLLLHLIGIKPSAGVLEGLDGTLIGARTRDLLLELLELKCLRTTVVLVLEDLHWIDSASEELLMRIVGGEKRWPLFVLHTRRPEYRPAWAEQPNVVQVRMAPLSSVQALRIAEARFGVDRLPEPLAQLIVEKAEGNALFVEEIVSYLLERGAVSRVGERLTFDPNMLLAALPASVKSLFTARVDRLSSDEKELLQIASVFGRRFDSESLAVVAEIRDGIDQRLAKLEEADLVQRGPKVTEYQFKHVLVRDALYDSLLTSTRAELHGKVASVIEQRSLNRISEVVEPLAYHFTNSSQHGKAFNYLWLSGLKCLDIYSLEEAERYFRRAIRVVESNPGCAGKQPIASVLADLLQVLYLRGDLVGLGTVAEEFVLRLQAMGDSPQLVFALYFHTMLLEHRCDFRAAEARANLALSIAQRLGDVRAAAYAQSALFFCSTILGRRDLELAEREGALMLDVCKRAGDKYILNWAYWSIAWDYVCRGLTKQARFWALQLMDAGRLRQDNRALGMAYWTLAWIDIQDVRYREAIANAQKCLETAATPFDRNAATMANATGLLLEGRLQEGLAQLLNLKRWALEHGWLYSASGVDFAAGPALAATGRVGQGIQMLQAGIAACDANGSLAMASWNRLALAEIYLQIILSNQRPPLGFLLRNCGAILWARLFGPKRAHQLLVEARQNVRIHPDGMTRCRIEFNLARLCLRQRQKDQAREHFNEARRGATAQESRLLGEIDEALRSLV